MTVTVEFGSLDEGEKRELAVLMLEEAEARGLAVALPERRSPYVVSEVSEVLGVSADTVYRMLAAGRLVAVAGLGKKLVVAESVHRVRDGLG